MLPKATRISTKAFKSLEKGGTSYHAPLLTLRVSKKDDCKEDISLFSFVVSKKVSKKAPMRNTLKRRGRAIVQGVYKDIKTCFICVFYYKKDSDKATYPELKKQILFLLKKAKIV